VGVSVNANTLGAMVLAATERYTGVAIRFPRGGAWHAWTFGELGASVRELARGLAALGLQPGDRVALLGETRPEWTLADCALLAAGLVVVPVYHTNSPEECAHVIGHSGSRAVLCENAAQLAKVDEVREQFPELEHAITFEATGRAPTLDDIRGRAGEVDPEILAQRQSAIGRDDVATIVYTSGTTGPPKGCMLTHGNFLSTVAAYEEHVDLRAPFTLFMFLPLAHALARVVQMVALDQGGELAFWSGDPRKLVDDVAAARPTHFPSVPRVFEKIHARAHASAGNGVRRRLFDWAVATGRRARAAERAGGVSPTLRARHRLADRLVLSKVRSLFGDRIQLALTGAAPIAREVLEFLDGCGVEVLEGYGMTESCAAATLNPPGGARFGTVGPAIPGTRVEVAADGEIVIRGPHVFAGYYRDEQATRAAKDGEGVRSGDLGDLDADGYLRITGRTKEIIITSSGKNVAPANLENALRESRWVSQAIVHGDNRPYLVALLTLDPDEAPALAAELGVEAELDAMAANEAVRAALQREVDAANSRFARIEQIKRFHLLPRDLSQDAGELTPTMKVKRSVVEERYRDTFAALYDG
jgi:long-chain acyl-CoA synthetase